MTARNPGPAVTTSTNSVVQTATVGPTTTGQQQGGIWQIPSSGVAGDGIADPLWGSIATPSAAALANRTATFIDPYGNRWIVNVAQTGLVPHPVGQAATIVRKIKAGFAAAAAVNPIDSQPWLPPATINTGPGNLVRANLTAYPKGVVLANAAGTYQFICFTAGTSAAAEPATMTSPLVTTTPYNYGPITDGSVTWFFLGPVRTTAALAGAPLVSSGSLPASLSMAQNFGNGVGGASPNTNFRFFGGTGAFVGSVASSSTYGVVVRGPLALTSASNIFSGTYLVGNASAAVEFITDAPYLALDLTSVAQSNGLGVGAQYMIEIDGRRLCDGPLSTIATLAAGSGFIILDWRSTGGRKKRTIRIGAGFNPIFGNITPIYARIYVTPADSFWYPTNPNRYRLAVIGSSIVQAGGNWPVCPMFDVASIFAEQIGCDDFANLGLGGTGFIATSSGNQYNYGQRISELVALQPDVVIILDAVNDATNTSAQRVSAITAYCQVVRGALPNAIIVMAGNWPATNFAGELPVETDMQTAVAALGDPWTFFYPQCGDNPVWSTGTGTNNAANGTGNSDIYIGPSDATHPSQMGLYYLASKHATAFRQLINSLAL